ncbi:acylneuraminate cytidylyltransferase family protein [Siccibacter colletis]|uniref:Acylneuraminate cytidylyltransferase family protein n=1 Tax=Siccibacter colletis TaxID=1505757 RepID=A0ABY6JA73_9ENTR|nr:acylneuraminate cytidylyltransferase family protein [Siccibacter colletis]UYU30725.1 acylneuraminate cytidylyltransferase family protein [Siccibacter colletis]
MINGKKIIAIIPARGGSKRLPGKNIKTLAGKPLIAWTIEAATGSTYIDKVVVSTDSKEIADVAKDWGCPVEKLRPEAISGDNASSESVLLYELKSQKESYEIVVLLQPTSPLKTSVHIDEAIEKFKDAVAQVVVSVTPCEHHPALANVLGENESMAAFEQGISSGKLRIIHHRLNGAIYVMDTEMLAASGKISYNDSTFAYVMDNQSSVDIDTATDFDYAEYLMNKRTLEVNKRKL